MEKLTLVKAGGKVLDSEQELSHLLDLMAGISGKKILVHGGGIFIDELCSKLQIPTQMVNGRRITSPETMEVVVMACAGKLNKGLVAGLNQRGLTALGLCGADLNLISSVKRNPVPVDFGMVGDITQVNVSALQSLLDLGLVPVISSITQSSDYELLNTNADTIAAYMSVALSAAFDVELFFYFDKAGVLLDAADEESVIPRLSKSEYEQMLATKAIHSGMLPKLQNGFYALQKGVQSVKLGNRIDKGTFLVN